MIVLMKHSRVQRDVSDSDSGLGTRDAYWRLQTEAIYSIERPRQRMRDVARDVRRAAAVVYYAWRTTKPCV